MANIVTVSVLERLCAQLATHQMSVTCLSTRAQLYWGGPARTESGRNVYLPERGKNGGWYRRTLKRYSRDTSHRRQADKYLSA